MNIGRGELVDVYVDDGRSVVMVEESVLVLSELATAILAAVPSGATVSLGEVTDHVVQTFGPPEEPSAAEELTRQQVFELVAHRVLVDLGDGGPDRPVRGQAVDALRDALRHLRSTSPGRWPLPVGVPSQAFVDAAHQHHVIPYLASRIDDLDLPASARSHIAAAAGRQRAGAAVLASDLAEALGALNAAEIRALAFKGVALAQQAYGDFTLRGAGDLDLLVAPEDLGRAYDALARAGWSPAASYPTPGSAWAWRHFVRTGNEVPLRGARSDIDLHWHLVPTRGTFPDFETLWSRRALVVVDGHETPTLSPYDALAHSAGHAAKDRWRWLRSLLDVHVLACERETWLNADRPLRTDQLFSLGLAARSFGTPPGLPAIVDRAREMVDGLSEGVHHEQATTQAGHTELPVPGQNFVFGLRGIARTDASPREAVRLLSRTALPPWFTADEPSAHAVVAVPRVLRRRARQLVQKAARL